MEKQKLKVIENLKNEYLICQYKIIKRIDTQQDHRKIIKFELALNKLNTEEKKLFNNIYFTLDNTWWKKYYTNKQYGNFKNITLNKFYYFYLIGSKHESIKG